MTLLLLLNQEFTTDIPDGSRAVTIGNSPDATASVFVGAISIDQDGDAFAIALDTASGQTLAPGASRVVAISFDASSGGGSHEATLRVPSSDPDGTLEVLLRGNVIVPVPGIAVDPPSWDAGDVETTGGSEGIAVTVSSTGTGPLAVGTIAISGSGFAKSGDLASGQSIPPGGSRTLNVTFDPPSNGAKSGTLTVPSDAGPDVVVALSGTGVASVPPPSTDPIPVTRLYLGRQAAPIALPSGYASGWWKATTDAPCAMTVAKGGPPTTWASPVDARPPNASLHATFVGPEVAAQEVATTIRCMLPGAYRSSALGSYVVSALRVGAWRAATSTVDWGPILAPYASVEPWPTVDGPLPRRFPAGDPFSWAVSLSLEEGDRPLVQVGCRVTNGMSPATAPTKLRYGGSSTQDDAPTSIHEAAPNTAAWIDLTDALLVLP